ncbi:glycosyltransferase [soil metagenome]
MKTAVVTVVHGRSAHLRRQLQGFHLSTVRPEFHVIVAISDDDIAAVVAADDGCAELIAVAGSPDRLPIAAARNLGADTAIAHGAELLVFLDVDCIAGPTLIARYRCAAADARHGAALLNGPVTYLPPPGQNGYDLAGLEMLVSPHQGRPAPPDGVIVEGTEYEYFWSLSFAVTVPTWRRIGGFCTLYTGYGAEDTDFAQIAASQSIGMRWVGGAHAFHQYHPVSDPPVEHVADILRNGEIFHRRWGWWPMRGWLDQFATRGLIEWRNGCPVAATNVGRTHRSRGGGSASS